MALTKELEGLLEKARVVEMTPEQLEEHRIALAAANGYLSDERITLDTVKATRTIMLAAETQNKTKAAA